MPCPSPDGRDRARGRSRQRRGVLIRARFREELHGSALHRLHGHRNVAVGCDEDDPELPVRRGTLALKLETALPCGQTLRFVANEENGSSTSDGTFRVFAGLRSDPFILAGCFAATR
jgi:hypothetical protein